MKARSEIAIKLTPEDVEHLIDVLCSGIEVDPGPHRRSPLGLVRAWRARVAAGPQGPDDDLPHLTGVVCRDADLIEKLVSFAKAKPTAAEDLAGRVEAAAKRDRTLARRIDALITASTRRRLARAAS